MIIEYHGSFISIHISANELRKNQTSVPLRNGYSYERIYLNSLLNITALYEHQKVTEGARITFPPVDCKSPSILWLYITDITKEAEIQLTIEKFGQTPDQYYFDRIFQPISVVGGDGNKYNIIPSDQFK